MAVLNLLANPPIIEYLSGYFKFVTSVINATTISILSLCLSSYLVGGTEALGPVLG